jgi:hypothetical protein
MRPAADAANAATCPRARSTTWMKSRTAVPSGVFQSVPKMSNTGRVPVRTVAITGIRLLGFCRGSSPKIPDSWQPTYVTYVSQGVRPLHNSKLTGLKYRRAVMDQAGSDTARSARMDSHMNFDRPYGDVRPNTPDATQRSVPSLSTNVSAWCTHSSSRRGTPQLAPSP